MGVAPHKTGKSRPANGADCLSRSIRCDGFGGVSRAAKGADCKSAGYAFVGSSSYLPHHLNFLLLFSFRFSRWRYHLAIRWGHRFSLFVRQRVHGVERKPLAACCLGIERGHPAALPAEDRFKLRHRCAVLGRARGRDLAQTMRRDANSAGHDRQWFLVFEQGERNRRKINQRSDRPHPRHHLAGVGLAKVEYQIRPARWPWQVYII